MPKPIKLNCSNNNKCKCKSRTKITIKANRSNQKTTWWVLFPVSMGLKKVRLIIVATTTIISRTKSLRYLKRLIYKIIMCKKMSSIYELIENFYFLINNLYLYEIL